MAKKKPASQNSANKNKKSKKKILAKTTVFKKSKNRLQSQSVKIDDAESKPKKSVTRQQSESAKLGNSESMLKNAKATVPRKVEILPPEAAKGVPPEADYELVADDKALAPSDPVSRYMSEIKRYPLLSREEERELAIRYFETGDAAAAERLVTSNLRFVVKIAAEYAKFGAKLIDLIQEGNVGLMHGVREYNPYKDVRLITYAVWWIRGYIQEYLMKQHSMVKIGTTQNQRRLFYKLRKEKELLDQMGHKKAVALLSGKMGIPESEIEEMSQRLSGRDISLSQPLDDSDRTTLLDLQKSPQEVETDEILAHQEQLQILKANIEKLRPSLNPKETFLLEKRLLADEPLTLQEVGDHYNITREAVRQMENRVIQKLRSLTDE